MSFFNLSTGAHTLSPSTTAPALTVSANGGGGTLQLTHQNGNNITVDATGNIQTPTLVGMVCHFAMATAPVGWLKCNGAAVSRTTYAALFAAIGTLYGVGDNSTTFNVPDLRGEFVRGWDDGRGVDSGRAMGGTQTDAFQGHFHSLQGRVNNSMASIYNNKVMGWYDGGSDTYNTACEAPRTDGANGIPRTAAETRPRNIALLACIKY